MIKPKIDYGFSRLDKNKEFQKAKKIRLENKKAADFDVEKCIDGVKKFFKKFPPRSFRTLPD